MHNPQQRRWSLGELPPSAYSLALCLAVITLSLGTPQGCAAQQNGDAPVGPATRAVASWSFDGDLADQTGRGNNALAAKPQFVDGHQGSALQADDLGAVVPDAPDLRLAPGLRLDCWVKPTRAHSGITYIVRKDQEYMLRLDPPDEGGRVSFFVYLDGNWEPRVQSDVAPQIGQWYHLVAGWDGQNLSLEVNGKVWRGQRSGTFQTDYRQLQLGPCEGLLDEVRLDNPGANATAEAIWPFEGDLRDASGHGHDGAAEGARFVSGAVGQALGPLAQPAIVPDSEALRIAPGFHLDCRVYFESVPADQQTIVAKEGEYMLRADPPKEGSNLSFFVNLDGWEPRVRTNEPVRAGQWYRILAHWDGLTLTLEVNGAQTHITRSGLCRGGNSPVTIGGPGMTVDEVRLDNPRRPAIRVVRVSQEHALTRAGTPETLTTVVQNLSQTVTGAVVRLDVPDTVRCLDSPAYELGALGPGETKTVQWRVTADRETSSEAVVRLTAEGALPAIVRHPLVFFPRDDQAAASRARMNPPSQGGKTYYVDSVHGSNANTGLSQTQPWQDFTKVNGMTLGPGDALLLKRGSEFRTELSLSAHGTADNWAVIGAYGTGPRPIIRRSWDIDDRCALLTNSDYLHVSSLVVCCAGKGLVAHYSETGHRGLLIEDCIAHHIEGLYRPNANGIPEWLNRTGAKGDALGTSAGIALSGAPAEDVVIRNCEMFQTSNGFFVMGDGVVLDRLYCHDNYLRNTSPHPFLVRVRRSYLQNSVFDASGWHASAGTMGIMLGDTRGLIIRNCTCRNQPDS
ncbi:MAG: LamG-like jellyroll fold domain-containing protein, partial [Armatimonadota bacterium]